MAIFAAPNLSAEHTPGYVYTIGRSDIASSGGIDLEPVLHLHLGKNKNTPASVCRRRSRAKQQCAALLHTYAGSAPLTWKGVAVLVGSLITCVGALNHAERNGMLVWTPNFA